MIKKRKQHWKYRRWNIASSRLDKISRYSWRKVNTVHEDDDDDGGILNNRTRNHEVTVMAFTRPDNKSQSHKTAGWRKKAIQAVFVFKKFPFLCHTIHTKQSKLKQKKTKKLIHNLSNSFFSLFNTYISYNRIATMICFMCYSPGKFHTYTCTQIFKMPSHNELAFSGQFHILYERMIDLFECIGCRIFSLT